MSERLIPIALVSAFAVTIVLLSIPKAIGQGAPQPIPVPYSERIKLVGATYKRGARVTIWTAAGHEFTGRLQDVSINDVVLIKREKDHVRIELIQVYAASIGVEK